MDLKEEWLILENYHFAAPGAIYILVSADRIKIALPRLFTLDATIGVACVSLFAAFDNPVRRTMYGLPGEFRTPKWGIEYRVLSNAWMFSPLAANIVIDVARKCVAFGKNGFRKYWQTNEQETIDIIMNCDVDRAREVLKRNEETFLKIIKSAYSAESEEIHQAVFKFFMMGMENFINPMTIAENWRLKGEVKWVAHSSGSSINLGQSGNALSTMVKEIEAKCER